MDTQDGGIPEDLFRSIMQDKLRESPTFVLQAAVAWMRSDGGLADSSTRRSMLTILLPWMKDSSNEAILQGVKGADELEARLLLVQADSSV